MSLLRHLEKNNPEALALAGDWDDSAQNLFTTRAKLDKYGLNKLFQSMN
jgi:U3 small nucleolar RNA-associated protein 3